VRGMDAQRNASSDQRALLSQPDFLQVLCYVTLRCHTTGHDTMHNLNIS